jgi:hypothetical protein
MSTLYDNAEFLQLSHGRADIGIPGPTPNHSNVETDGHNLASLREWHQD